MMLLEKFGIDTKKEGIERLAIYSVACTFSLAERKIAEYLRSYNLSPVKFNALMVIKRSASKKGISQVDISRQLIVTASNITRLLDRMNKEGLIQRYASEKDRRVNMIKITQKGSDLLDKAWPGYCKIMGEVASGLGKHDLRQVTAIMLKWLDRLYESGD